MIPLGRRYTDAGDRHKPPAACVDVAVPLRWNGALKGKARHLSNMLVAIAAMFLQQTCGSVGRVLPAVLAPLIIVELHACAATTRVVGSDNQDGWTPGLAGGWA